jgi:hypothetical protein
VSGYIEITKDSGNFKPAQGDSDQNMKVNVAARTGLSAAQVTADGNIKASAGTLHALTVAGAGVTAGDTVEIEDGSGGTTLLTIVFGAANETIHLPGLDIDFDTAIYVDVDLTGGSVYVTGVYS